MATGTHISHMSCDHTVLPATRQSWHSRLYLNRSWYSIKRPRRDARLSLPRHCSKGAQCSKLLHPLNGLFSRRTWVSRYQKGIKWEKRWWGFGMATASAGPYAINLHRAPDTAPPAPHHSIFTGRMLFLTPNQQCQSTEGSIIVILYSYTNKLQFLPWPTRVPSSCQQTSRLPAIVKQSNCRYQTSHRSATAVCWVTLSMRIFRLRSRVVTSQNGAENQHA